MEKKHSRKNKEKFYAKIPMIKNPDYIGEMP
jgi:hypothetical protein